MAIVEDFADFWRKFPRKVGKLAAQKAYTKARKMASAQELIDGVDRYLAAKPAYADICFPATFLNQGRWLDETTPARDAWICPHVVACGNRAACSNADKLGRPRKP